MNTAPLISLVAANSALNVLQSLYDDQVLVPFKVSQEILVRGASGFGVAEFEAANWLQKWQSPLNISPLLLNALDLGEETLRSHCYNHHKSSATAPPAR